MFFCLFVSNAKKYEQVFPVGEMTDMILIMKSSGKVHTSDKTTWLLTTVTEYLYFTPLETSSVELFLSTNIYSPFYLLIISPRSPSSLPDQRHRPDLLCPKHTNIFPMMSASCPAQLGSRRLSQGSRVFFPSSFSPPSSRCLTAAADSSGIRKPRPLHPLSRRCVSWVTPPGNLGAPLPLAGSSCLLWEVLRGVRVAWWASGSHTADIYYFILSPPFALESREAANIQHRG